jgi:hypothetical protein
MLAGKSASEFSRAFFAAPRIVHLEEPLTLLSGGLSRLHVRLLGWGRVDAMFLDADGHCSSLKRLFIGLDTSFFVEIRPPGVLSITATNIFGSYARDWILKTNGQLSESSDFAVQVRHLRLAVQVPPQPSVVSPVTARINPFKLRLPPLKVPMNFWSEKNE